MFILSLLLIHFYFNTSQYIPCYGLSIPFIDDLVQLVVFQYIPCYGLSNLAMRLYWWHSYFNTSHVTVYLARLQKDEQSVNHFNTSHVTVYHSLLYPVSFLQLYFNTSHVTVYLADVEELAEKRKFQYIPCYGLSKGTLVTIQMAKEFQYIPCYGLSRNVRRKTRSQGYFNTSHVTVYL